MKVMRMVKPKPRSAMPWTCAMLLASVCLPDLGGDAGLRAQDRQETGVRPASSRRRSSASWKVPIATCGRNPIR